MFSVGPIILTKRFTQFVFYLFIITFKHKTSTSLVDKNKTENKTVVSLQENEWFFNLLFCKEVVKKILKHRKLN